MILQTLAPSAFRALPDDVQLDGRPSDYRFPLFVLQGLFKGEAEEVLARMIFACQQIGSWHAMTYQGLGQAILDELNAARDAAESANDIRRDNRRALRLHRIALSEYEAGMVEWANMSRRQRRNSQQPTLPKIPELGEVEVVEHPFSMGIVYGTDMYNTGLTFLIDHGYVAKTETTDGDVIYLTPRAIEAIERWKISEEVSTEG